MKFVVLKIEDIQKYCAFEQEEQLAEICNRIEAGRMKDKRKAENHYLVINTDEPYAKEVKAIIEENEGEEVIFE